MFYIDTNVIIYDIIDDSQFGLAAHNLMSKIAAKEIEVCSSVYLFAEIFATFRFFKKSTEEIYSYLKDLTIIGISFVDLTPSVLIPALELYREGMKFGDAIHYKTIQLLGIDQIITENKHFDSLKRIERVSLSQIGHMVGSRRKS